VIYKFTLTPVISDPSYFSYLQLFKNKPVFIKKLQKKSGKKAGKKAGKKNV